MEPLFPEADRPALLTDLYELTMAAAFDAAGLADTEATFEVFVRRLPADRGYLVAAGLEQFLAYLLRLRFTAEDIAWLRSRRAFAQVPASFFERLAAMRFTGEVWALPEGTVCFADEPIVRVTGPLLEAQVVETFLLSMVGYQTLVATKASRVVLAAGGRTVVDFGSRRAHGPQAGLLAARASFIGGCAGTSNVYAASRLGIPAVGTQAHSWVMAQDDEAEAFRRYAALFPETAIMLIDTYNVEEGARRAAGLGRRLAGVRIDSGDLDATSRRVRAILDQHGAPQARIVASGDLDEYSIEALARAGAPIDTFGVGTAMVTSLDAPALGIVYKLVECVKAGRREGRMKLSPGKRTYPGRKQVFRTAAADGTFAQDVIAGADECLSGEPLLEKVMSGGRVTVALPDLGAIQERCRDQLRRLPEACKRLRSPAAFPVYYSPALERVAGQASVDGGR